MSSRRKKFRGYEKKSCDTYTSEERFFDDTRSLLQECKKDVWMIYEKKGDIHLHKRKKKNRGY